MVSTVSYFSNRERRWPEQSLDAGSLMYLPYAYSSLADAGYGNSSMMVSFSVPSVSAYIFSRLLYVRRLSSHLVCVNISHSIVLMLVRMQAGCGSISNVKFCQHRHLRLQVLCPCQPRLDFSPAYEQVAWEIMHAMSRPVKFKYVYLFATLCIFTLTIPSSMAIYWAFGDSLLDNANALQLLPKSPARDVAVLFMLIHQVPHLSQHSFKSFGLCFTFVQRLLWEEVHLGKVHGYFDQGGWICRRKPRIL